MIEPGEPAPAFTLRDADGQEVSLEDFRGQPVVVYFYPKDDTPGCTAQACGIRDQWAEFEQRGAAVLGISPDDRASHERFRDKHDLPHRLLSDPEHRVMQEYGAWGPKNLYGRMVEGVIRSTVVVGPDGRVVRHFRRVQARKHADQVLRVLDELAG